VDYSDQRLRAYATAKNLEYLDAIEKHGSARKAESALGLSNDVISRSLRDWVRRAATKGYSPDHDMVHPTPDPFIVKGVSTYYDKDGNAAGQWVKTSIDNERRLEILKEAVRGFQDEIPRLDPIEGPSQTNQDLANLYVFTDYHFGMMAWHKEGGGDWDLNIAERLMFKVMEQMVASSPNARVGVLAQLGDLLHADGLLPITPTHGHVLDADGRFSKVVQVAIRTLRRVIDIMLMKHEEVHVIMAEGNHDIASSVWLRQMFAALYENEPRVSVNDSELPYYVYQHGETMLAFHHGHMLKREQLPLLFAAQFPKVWGATSKRYAHCGHQHHERTQEFSGIKVTQHPTLAARDAHSSRGGWISERQASCITYHKEHGKVGEVVITPEAVA
jgi:hypothetical protein